MYVHKSWAPLMPNLIKPVKYGKFHVQTVWALRGSDQGGITLISVGRTAQKSSPEIPSHGCSASCTRIAPASRPPDERAGGDPGESEGDDSECENEALRHPPHLYSFFGHWIKAAWLFQPSPWNANANAEQRLIDRLHILRASICIVSPSPLQLELSRRQIHPLAV